MLRVGEGDVANLEHCFPLGVRIRTLRTLSKTFRVAPMKSSSALNLSNSSLCVGNGDSHDFQAQTLSSHFSEEPSPRSSAHSLHLSQNQLQAE
jgi:hypothetical protein